MATDSLWERLSSQCTFLQNISLFLGTQVFESESPVQSNQAGHRKIIQLKNVEECHFS